MSIFEAWTVAYPATSFECAASSATFKIFTFNVENLKYFVSTWIVEEIRVSAARLCVRISNPGQEQYIDQYGEVLPEIRNWKWSNPK